MNIIIDTCSWINLANESFEKNYLTLLEALIDKGQINLIVPEIVIDEWNKHKVDRVLNSRLASLNTKIKHARSISKLLDEDKMFRLDDLISEVSRLKPRIENEARKGIKIIDQLFTSERTIKLKITDDLKLIASEWAIEKLPPFGEKNSMKDALIFLSSIEFLKGKVGEENYFISDNITDFALRIEKGDFSPHLKSLADSVGLKFIPNIPLFMKEFDGIEIEENDKKTDDLYSKDFLIHRLKSTEICHQCGKGVKFSWLRSFHFPGLSLHITCPNCGYDIDTLEFWD